jgi:hypothetical protein
MGYYFAIGLAAFEIIAFLLTMQLKGIGKKRGAAISGWISLFVGSIIIINSGRIGTNQLSFYFLSITGMITILAILFIFLSKDKPQVFLMKFFNGFFTLLLEFGWLIGIFMPVVLAILGV